MCSMDLTLCTPIHEMYVVSVPTRGLSVMRVYRGLNQRRVSRVSAYFLLGITSILVILRLLWAENYPLCPYGTS